MNRFDDILLILERYSLDVDSHLSIETTCTICKRLLIESYRGNCGCRYCKKCITQYLIEQEKCCPGETDECKKENLSFSINVKDDIATDEVIAKLSVKCPMTDCEYQGQIIDMCDHLKTCDKGVERSHSENENNDNTTNNTIDYVNEYNDLEIDEADKANESSNQNKVDETVQEERSENLAKEIKDLANRFETLMTTTTERTGNYEQEIVMFKKEINKYQQEMLDIRDKIENDENIDNHQKEVEEEISSLRRKHDDLINVIAELREYNERQVVILQEIKTKHETEMDEMKDKRQEEKMNEKTHLENVQLEISDLKTKYNELVNLVVELKESNEKQSIMSDEAKIKHMTEVSEIKEQHDRELMELRESLREILGRVTVESNDTNQSTNHTENSIDVREDTVSIPDQLNVDQLNSTSSDRMTNIAFYVWDIGKFSRLKKTKTCIQSDYFLTSNSEYQMSLWLYPNGCDKVADPHIRIMLGIRSGVGNVESRWSLKSIIDISIKNKMAPDSIKQISKNRIFEQPGCEVFDFFTAELDLAHVLDNNYLLIECAVRIDE